MKICLECVTPNSYEAVYCYACGALFTDDTPAGATHRLRPGQLLNNKYTIERLVGQGGMGTVYQANQTIANNKRQVIVKERLDYYDLNDPQGKRKARQLFEKEAATLVKLNIAGIPQIFDYFSESRHNYIVMQFIQGQSLERGLTHKDGQGRLIAGEPYPVGQVRRWGVQVCKILENLAELDVVHMDIKPANLILDQAGNVWLVDFGTARAEGTAHVAGSVGMQKSSIYGTAGYAPMEQYQQHAEPRSDVYALAATLYHMLTDDDPRKHPFKFPKLEQLPPGLVSALQPALVQEVNKRITAAQFYKLLEVRPVVGSAFRWRDGTASHQPEELVDLASQNWAEARDYFSDGSWEHWFLSLHRNDMLAQLAQAKEKHPHVDMALDAFLRALDPKFPTPRLQLTPPALDFGPTPWQSRQTLDLEIQNSGGGCLYGKLVPPSGVRVSSTEPVDLIEEPEPIDFVLSEQSVTVKLRASSPPLPADEFISSEPEAADKSGASSSTAPSAFPANWFATPDRQTFKVTVDTDSMTPRSRPYTARLLVKVGFGSPAQAEVPLTVTVPKPRLALSPSKLDLDVISRGETPVGVLTVSNPGQSAFEGQVQGQANWVAFKPASFRCEPGASIPVSVEVDTSRIGLGRHTTPLKVQAQAAKWKQSQDVPVVLHLPWLRTLWYGLATILDAAAVGLLLMLGLFGLVRNLLGFAPTLGIISILVFIIGGLLAFVFPKVFLIVLLIVAGVGLGYGADLWLGLAPTLALAGVIGFVLGAGLRSKHTGVPGAGLFGVVVLIAALVGAVYLANQPNFSTYWWRRTQTLDTDSIGLALSPDGGMLASTQNEIVQLLRLADGSPVHTLNKHNATVNDIVFSADGSLLASGSSDTTVWLWQPASGTPARMLAGHTSRVLSVGFSPDGRLLASGTGDGVIWLWQVDNGSLVQTLNGHITRVSSVAFSPDGMLLASGGGDRKVRLWRVADGAMLRGLAGHGSDVASVAFSPDGMLLASGSADHTIRLWHAVECAHIPDKCETPVHTLVGHTEAISSVAFSPDGTMLASSSYDKNIKLWRVSDGLLLRTLKGQLSPVYRVAFTPDGTLVSTCEDGTTRLWSLGEGTPVQ